MSSMIRVRGARQNNLQGVDLDLPTGQLIVVTGPSGSGKSSLAFDTLYAEGQRRYVETFSPYTRQFLDRMDKPRVDEIDGIPPAIAIGQSNHVKTTRSTVGTITEINDYLKMLFPRAAVCLCPSCGREVRPESAKSVTEHILAELSGQQVLVTFGVAAPPGTATADFFGFLNQQGYLRVLLYGKVLRTDELPEGSVARLPAMVPVVQDRVEVFEGNATRLAEAVEAALRLGQGRVGIWEVASEQMHPYSTGWHCAHCDLDLRPPSPGLFSFNSPLGACPSCKGFGRVIGIDWSRVMPDTSLSIAQGVIKPFQGSQSAECQRDLLRVAQSRDVDIHCPFDELPEADRKWVIEGEGKDSLEAWENGRWYGVKGYFEWLESKTYKMHVRVLLSRYRSYGPCPECNGGRFQPETLNFRLRPGELTLPQVAALPVRDLCKFFETIELPKADPAAALLRTQVLSRARFLEEVGLGYLTLDRPTRSLSGGEIERVNLTACLGASLTNTLFVLDEPSVGLHPRDTARLIGILHALRDKGNTLVVVEHEEAVIRAADHLVDVGPGRGVTGGTITYSGPAQGLASEEVTGSLTKDYLTGGKSIPIPSKRRKPKKWVRLRGIQHHNLNNVNADIPLGVLCCVTGVSGSGKSSLVHGVLYHNLSGETAPEGVEVGRVKSVRGDEVLGDVIMVDQSPLARSPRSTPAVYVGAYDRIRELYGTQPEALAAGLSPGSFSFNAGDGRCGRCGGLGYEKVEMQFLSDLFLRCPECDGKRFQPHVLALRYADKSIHDTLELTVTEALAFFADHPSITRSLQVLEDVGLGYLRLGQPVNELSGGESQRLKLASHLASQREEGALLIFDEPTTGLHFDDIARLLEVFQKLVRNGDSLIVIEHNLEVIKSADWVIDLGPEAGDRGGEVVVAGTPEQVAECAESHTGRFLSRVLASEGTQLLGTARPRPSGTGLNGAIAIRGAREHNLKNLNVDVPRGKIVVVTGLSGSGKSTLAFDILFAEGQRRFLDSMSAYARQFVEQLEKPEVDSIEGLPPSVAIEQRVTRGGGKSTVATVTEIYHFLRLLFAKVGVQHCPSCNTPVVSQSASAITASVANYTKDGPVKIYAPLVRGRKGFHTKVASWAVRQGIEMLLVDGREMRAESFKALERFKEHDIDALVGVVTDGGKAARDIVTRALRFGKGTARVVTAAGVSHILSTEMNCPDCGRSFESLEPRLFSFNSPHGWCGHCRGFGEVWKEYSSCEHDSQLEAELAEERAHESLEEGHATMCPVCRGTRLNETARHVFVQGVSITDFSGAPAERALAMLDLLEFRGTEAKLAADIAPEIRRRLDFLRRVGLEYLTLNRSANTLSGGEAQRIRLAAQLGSNLRGVLYVLDEPTIGLHARDNSRLLDALEELARGGNSLVIVEHDEETMRRADHILDLGPGAGSQGGEIVAQGSFANILASETSLTAASLRSPMRHPSRGTRRPLYSAPGWLALTGASLHNLQNIDVRFPINRLSVVTGISGSGKSTLVRGVLDPAVRDAISRSRRVPSQKPYHSLAGADLIGAVLEVDQSPIGKSSRSTPATYIKVLNAIRALYADLPASRMRGYTASRFSFNNEGGRCETCQGQGVIKLEMNFLPPAYMPCQECAGKRYNPATLEVEYNGKSIGDVMAMTAAEAAAFFSSHPRIRRSLDLLVETGLGYLQLGQPSPTLSGGEAQRIKLVTEVSRRATGSTEEVRTTRAGKSTLYILEEPTIGLHAHDVARLIDVLHRLVDEGGTVIVVEHHMDVIAEADYVVDIGPGAGEYGGQVVAHGTPEDVAKVRHSATAPFLKATLLGKSITAKKRKKSRAAL